MTLTRDQLDAHSAEIDLWWKNPDAKVYYRNKDGDWKHAQYPSWLSGGTYRVILPEYQDLWQAWLDDELEDYALGSWTRWDRNAAPPKFTRPPSNYRRKPKPEPKPHHHQWLRDLAKKNPDAKIYYFRKIDDTWQEVTDCCLWDPHLEYRVILPEYREAWEAYIDGELEYCGLRGTWGSWDGGGLILGPPNFTSPAVKYRRKPKPEPHAHQRLIDIAEKNPDAKIYYLRKSDETWDDVTTCCIWDERHEYQVVRPEYQDAWEAYIDGELEIKAECDGLWFDWALTSHPAFSFDPSNYRRKPKPETIAVRLDLLQEVVDQMTLAFDSIKVCRGDEWPTLETLKEEIHKATENPSEEN